MLKTVLVNAQGNKIYTDHLGQQKFEGQIAPAQYGIVAMKEAKQQQQRREEDLKVWKEKQVNDAYSFKNTCYTGCSHFADKLKKLLSLHLINVAAGYIDYSAWNDFLKRMRNLATPTFKDFSDSVKSIFNEQQITEYRLKDYFRILRWCDTGDYKTYVLSSLNDTLANYLDKNIATKPLHSSNDIISNIINALPKTAGGKPRNVKKTVKELRVVAKARGLHGYSKLKKAELVELLRKKPKKTKA